MGAEDMVVDSGDPAAAAGERLTDDGGVVKKVLDKGGDGWKCPEDGDEVLMHYTGKLLDGSVFDSSVARSEPFKFKLGQGSVIKGWDVVTKTMTKGEKAEVTLAPQYAYGDAGSPPKIPKNATLVFTMELISWVSERDIFGDGGVMRTELIEGQDWERPADKSEVTLKILATDPDSGKVFFDGEKTFTVNGTDSHPSWDRIIVDMKKGGTVGLLCKDKYLSSPGVDFLPPDCKVFHQKLTLVSWLKVEDVASDGGIIKKITLEGEGWERPNEGSLVTINGEAAVVRDGQIMAPFAFFNDFSFKVNDGEVVDGLDRAVQSMKKKEEALVTLSPDYGYKSCPNICPPEVYVTDQLQLRLQLTTFDKAKDTWSMSFEEKVVEMKERKLKGNELYKAGRIKLAMKAYERAISFFEYSTSELSPELKKDVNVLLVQCQLNMAACHEKEENIEKVLNHCKLALDIEPANVKALYRRGRAYLKLDDYYKAESDLKYALELDPANVEVRRKLKELNEKRRKQDASDRRLFSNMFSRLSKLEELENSPDHESTGMDDGS